jgi:hypothetical protein
MLLEGLDCREVEESLGEELVWSHDLLVLGSYDLEVDLRSCLEVEDKTLL